MFARRGVLAEVSTYTDQLLTEIASLRAQLADAQFTIRELRKVPSSTHFRTAFKMTHGEAQLLSVIVKHGRVTKERAHNELYECGPDADVPNIKLLDTLICTIRRKLKPSGITIKTIWGEGWEISPEDRAKLRWTGPDL